MQLDLVDTLHAQSFVRLPLETSVDEVGRLLRIALRQILLTDVSLLIPNRIPDRLSIWAKIGSPAHDALVTDHANGEIISRNRIILFEHYFRRHIAGSAGVISPVLSLPDSSNSEVS